MSLNLLFLSNPIKKKKRKRNSGEKVSKKKGGEKGVRISILFVSFIFNVHKGQMGKKFTKKRGKN